MKLVGLLDCNNFFVSCERLFRPDLHRRPVVVLSGNDGCVVARSNEVKDLGVPMGVPYFQVRELLTNANAAVFSSNFTLYRDISRRVMDTLATLVDEVEVYSIDEAFFTLTATDTADAVTQLQRIKQLIEQHVGVPVSLGAAASKTIAKYASEVEKRGSGVCVLWGDDWRARTATIPLREIWGIGRRLSERFTQHQLHTVADVLAADRMRIAKLFGVNGCRIFDELNEQTVWPVGESVDQVPKSIMSSRSFKTATQERRVVLEALSFHVHQVAAELRQQGLECRYLQVLARPSRHGDWVLRPGTAEAVLTLPTNDTRILLREVGHLLDSFFDRQVPYKKAGVVVGWFSPETTAQPDLFGEVVQAATMRPVMKVMDELNQRFGLHTVMVGCTSNQGPWASARDHLSPHYTTKWPEIRTIRL
jgi:DNA polymerase V